MPDIKTRDAVKGTIRTIDKSAVAAERMKDAYIRTKDKAEHSAYAAENSPEEYAADRVTGSTETIARETAHQANKQGKKAVSHVKDRISEHKEHLAERKADQPREQAREVAKQRQEAHYRTRQSEAKPTGSTPPASSNTPIKTADRQPMAIRTRETAQKTVKQSARSSGKATIKTAKGGVKTAERGIKTAEQTSRVAIKTTEQAARQAQAAAKTAAKSAEKAAHAAKVAAQKAAQAAKRTAELTAKAVKAIIAAVKELIAAIIAGGWVSLVVILIIVLLGVAIALFGGGSGSSNSSYTPVSAEVEAYTPTIRIYAQQYGIGEYVELIKAVMMQESGGRGNDPMQCSESGYNTRYDHAPNSITDPAYSIEVGVHTLAVCLSEAGVENPIDMDHIKLALQGYNYGNGFISWAKTNYGGYSIAAAIEFSDQQAQRLGWSSYGDKQYVSHVLRYYPYGRAFTAGGNTAIVEIALTQLGNEGGEPYWTWWGYSDRVEWCAIFVSWCADQCGYLDSGVIPRFQGVDLGSEWFKNNGQWQDNTYEPNPGDIIFFDWEPDDDCDHVGIVEKCENGIVYTVEGNSTDACRQRQYTVGSSNIYGYGLLCP